MKEANEWVEELEALWNKGELTEFTWKVATLYNAVDYRLVSEVMNEFKHRISK